MAERSLPAVEILDLREEFKQTHTTSPISSRLREALQECLNFQTQALVLINRRGYSWSVICRSCGATVQCANCSISMTHHKHIATASKMPLLRLRAAHPEKIVPEV